MKLMLAAALSIVGGFGVLLAGTDGSDADRRNTSGMPVTIASPAPEPEDAAFAEPFAKGTIYGSKAVVDLVDTEMVAGEGAAPVKVTLSQASPNTVIAFIRCRNGSGGRAKQQARQAIIFRPGDPLVRWARCKVSAAEIGDTIEAVQAEAPDGAKRGRANATITVTKDAPSFADTEQDFRKPYGFAPLGKKIYSAAGSEIEFSDEGGPGQWSTSLHHGRSQPGNAETGYYGEKSLGGFAISGSDLRLISKRLAKPATDKPRGTTFPFLASVLSGHNTPDTQFRYGSVEWVAKMPDRRFSWPALWLLPTIGWPPEIDVYEGFGHNNEWKFDSSLSTNLHGGQKNKRSFDRLAFNMEMSDFGLANTLTTEFHKFQVTVDPRWITMFVDGIETMRYANAFTGRTWYPIMNVAVKAKVDDAYDAGSGEMVLRSVSIWRYSLDARPDTDTVPGTGSAAK